MENKYSYKDFLDYKVLAILFFIGLVSYLVIKIIPKEEVLPSYVSSVRKYKDVPRINLSLDVRLSERINEIELQNLAYIIYKRYNGAAYEKVFIDYLIVGMTQDNGAYATSHFNPNLKVTIYGLSNDNITYIKSDGFSDRKYWIDDGLGVIISIKREDGFFYLFKYFKDLGVDKKKLQLKFKGADTLYVIKGSTGGEYYKINSADDLELYDDQGWVYTMIKEKTNKL
ncbi:hypothetical protein [Epilithonimonas caeni]|uniref:hypothetical protein n=1 Tax=Epilithonimonas caeni TaxID=365343 RepID=UPI00040A522D|nr:hypothetical protein [Epilithonimonas caeni]